MWAAPLVMSWLFRVGLLAIIWKASRTSHSNFDLHLSNISNRSYEYLPSLSAFWQGTHTCQYTYLEILRRASPTWPLQRPIFAAPKKLFEGFNRVGGPASGLLSKGSCIKLQCLSTLFLNASMEMSGSRQLAGRPFQSSCTLW